MSLPATEFAELRSGVGEIAMSYGQEYCRECDMARAYLTTFVKRRTVASWTSPARRTGSGIL